jgi:hypothetical protein
MNGDPGDFSYEWFSGASMDVPLSIATDVDTVTNLSAGFYSVRITNLISQCVSSAQAATINDAHVNPQIVAILSLSDQESCINPDGALMAKVAGDSADYDFKWYTGQEISGSIISSSATITNLSAGVYTVLVTDKTTKCKSLSSQSIDNISGLLASIEIESHMTSCIQPNGMLSVSVDEGVTEDYSFEWYLSSQLFTSLPISTNSSASDLSADMYSVFIVHDASGCESVITSIILDQSTGPLVTFDVSNVTSCDGDNGVVRALAEGEPSDYSYEWYAGTDTVSFSDGEIIDSLAAGTYTALVTHNISGCSTTASTIVIEEQFEFIASVSILSHVISCVSPNGSLSVDVVSGDSSTYDFEWRENPGETIFSTLQTVTGLLPGTYGVTVTHSVLKCSTILSAEILDQKVIPEFTTTVISNSTSCNEPDGALEANILIDTLGTLDFKWFTGPNTAGTQISNAQLADHLAPGIYTVLITDTLTGCYATGNAIVVNNQFIPDASIAFEDNLLSVGYDNDYIYSWFKNNEPLEVDTNQFTPDQGGLYHVQIVTTKGCSATSEGVEIVVTASEESQKETHVCYPNPTDGELWVAPFGSGGYLKITDMNGKVIQVHAFDKSLGPFLFDLSAHAGGTYIITLIQDNKVSHFPVIKK